jgi:hypothetical protein
MVAVKNILIIVNFGASDAAMILKMPATNPD